MVRADRERIVEAVQNLMDNAVKFMGDQWNPMIQIGARGTDRNGFPILFVEDNGIGIDPVFQDQVFGLFNKLDPSTEGTGIGLAIVKRIIETHGGRIWVESEGKGKVPLHPAARNSHHTTWFEELKSQPRGHCPELSRM